MKAEKLNVNRDIYNVAWGDEGAVDGETVKITFENQADGDKSVTTDANDGNTTVTVAEGWTGTDSCVVEGSEGGRLEFEVEFAG